MGWNEFLDSYCERTAPGLLNEPFNLFSNASFFLVALILFRQKGSRSLPDVRLLASLVFMVGVGSALFHSFATRWAMFADVVPIGIFIFVFVIMLTRNALGLKLWGQIASVVFFLIVNIVCLKFLDAAYFNESNGYFGTWIATFILGWVCMLSNPSAAKNFFIAAGVFGVAVFFRTMDMWVCQFFKTGVHFVWHILNGICIYFAIQGYMSLKASKAPIS